MDEKAPPILETDPRFPSGPWTGFFLQKSLPGRHLMEFRLTFRNGAMTGEGRDWVGPFLVKGRYDLADGKCHWTKRYLGKHDVFYQGFNEGKGIWGVWEIALCPAKGAPVASAAASTSGPKAWATRPTIISSKRRICRSRMGNSSKWALQSIKRREMARPSRYF